MEMLGKVRRMHYRDGLSHSEISRRTGLSRNTVKKWVKAPEGSQPRYRRDARPGKLTAWHEALIQALRADARRPKHERRSGRALHAQIKAAGYKGSYPQPSRPSSASTPWSKFNRHRWSEFNRRRHVALLFGHMTPLRFKASGSD